MPLSEREQQILDELEKELRGERRSGPGDRAGSGERLLGLKVGVLLVVMGVMLLVWFFVSGFLLVGVVAFAAMVAGVVLGASSIRSEVGRGPGPGVRIARIVGDWERSLRRRDRNED